MTLGKSAILPRSITLYCVSLAKSSAENTEKLLQGTIGGGAPRAPSAALYSNSAAGSRHVCDAPLCGSMSKHFTCSFVAERFKSTFHVFALRSKNISLLRSSICSLTAHLYLRKNFTSAAAEHRLRLLRLFGGAGHKGVERPALPARCRPALPLSSIVA